MSHSFLRQLNHQLLRSVLLLCSVSGLLKSRLNSDLGCLSGKVFLFDSQVLEVLISILSYYMFQLKLNSGCSAFVSWVDGVGRCVREELLWTPTQ